VPWEGTLGFSSKPSESFHIPSIVEDLMALAKSAFLMIYNETLSDLDLSNEEAVSTFLEATI
jgi:hypothetical protein